MLLFTAYRKYPFKVSARTRFFDVIRYFFKIRLLERLLVYQLANKKNSWRRFIPPLYFYKRESMRTATREEINYQLDLSCLIDHAIFFYIVNEPSWRNLLKYVKSDDVVWDVGANIGFITLNLARICQSGHVFSFEPSRSSYQALKTNLSLNVFHNTSVFNMALGSASASMPLFNIQENNPGANRILPQKNNSSWFEMVEVTTGDLMAEKLQLDRLNIIKIDVEGFEVFVLEGLRNTIIKFKPLLFVELAEVNLNQQGFTCNTLMEYIEELGYYALDAKTMGPIDKSKKNHHTDILCFPVEKINH